MGEHHGIICSLATGTLQHLVQYEVKQQYGEGLMVMYKAGPASQ